MAFAGVRDRVMPPVAVSISSELKLKIFVSYSRRDAEFAEGLVAALEACGYEPFVDKQDIAPGEPWEDRLARLIQSADTVVFAVSPASVSSQRCSWEIDKAEELGKRILPVVVQPVPEQSAPERLRRLNYIFFTEGRPFGVSLNALARALNTDLDWIREHTRLGELAVRWNERGRSEALLLHGDDIQTAKQWVGRRPRDAPDPTLLQREFIAESEKVETARYDLEQRRIERARRTWRLTLASAAAAMVGISLAAFAYWQSLRATANEHRALRAEKNALLTRSLFLADLSRQATLRGDATTGILLALEALPDADSENSDIRSRPPTDAAWESLATARRSLRERWVLDVGPGESRLAANADGTRAVTALSEGRVKVWDLEKRAVLSVLAIAEPQGISVAMSADGSLVVTGGSDNVVRLWEATSGKELKRFEGHQERVESVVITPDRNRIVSGSADKTIRIWDIQSGTHIALHGHQASIEALAVDAAGAHIISGSQDKTARVWNIRSDAPPVSLNGHNAPIMGVTFLGSGARVATASLDGTLRIWEAATGREIQVVGETSGAGNSGASGLTAIAATPDGKQIITASRNGIVRSWDAVSGIEQFRLMGSSQMVGDIAITREAATMLVASADGTLRRWHIGNQGTMFREHVDAVTSVTRMPNDERVATGSGDGTIKIWDLQTGSTTHTLRPTRSAEHRDSMEPGIAAFAVTPDGSRIVAGDENGSAFVLDVASGRTIAEMKSHDLTVWSVAVSPDGIHAVTGSGDGIARVWRVADGTEVGVLKGHDKGIEAVAVTPDGLRYVTASEDGTARIWSAETRTELLLLQGHHGPLTSVLVLSGGRRLATGSADGTVRIWDTGTGTVLKVLEAGEHSVLSLASSVDGREIVAGTKDGSIHIWDVETGKLIDRPAGHSGGVQGVAVTRDGTRFVSASLDETARVWQLLPSGQRRVAEAKQLVPRCLTADQRKTYYFVGEQLPTWCKASGKWSGGAQAASPAGGR